MPPPTVHHWVLHHRLTGTTPADRTGTADRIRAVALVGYTRDDRPIVRYWIGPADSPAAHVFQAQGRQLARVLGGPLTEARE